jgi:hypothetical protein
LRKDREFNAHYVIKPDNSPVINLHWEETS